MTTNNVLDPNASDTRIRQIFYKKPIKKGNYRLDEDYDDSAQEIRRQELLQRQKESRDAAFNGARAILDDALLSDDENEEPMEVDKKRHHRKINKHYAHKLMMSEWMLQVPQDLSEKWSMVPCPKGRRNLIVARKGKTQAFSRRGEKLVEFVSALPGGNSDEYNKNCTILDCIWVGKQKIYYVLDCLAWSTQPLLNCDTEFRRFWLESKLNENPTLKLREKSGNSYPILSLPSVRCSENLSEFVENLQIDTPLDGFLFYHQEGHYMHGFTPLVTWLKPFMLPEVLGVSIPLQLDEKPDGYLDLQHYVQSGRHKKKESDESSAVTMDVLDVNT